MTPSGAVTVIIPVYNEVHFIEPLLRKVKEVSGESEVIVVNDGSTDATASIVARLQPESKFRTLTHTHNQGKGAAIRTGLQHARGDVVLIQDADLEYDPSDYPVLLKPLLENRAQVVYGSRFLKPGYQSYFTHRVGNWAITAFVNLLFGSSLTDAETCYKAFRKDVLKDIHLRARGFEFEVEFTCEVLRAGHRILEVPVTYHGRTYAEGKKITWKDGIIALLTILRCRFVRSG